jgi:hypothetical protein
MSVDDQRLFALGVELAREGELRDCGAPFLLTIADHFELTWSG